MFNPNTERLLDYWRGRRTGRPAPRRADIDPADFARLTAQVFIAAREGGDYRFRLAGEAVAALCGRPLGGESALRLWRIEDRGRLVRLLAASLAGAEPLVVLGEAAQPPGGAARLAILFAPLADAAGEPDRFLGLVQPLAFGLSAPIPPLSIAAVNGLEETARRAHLRLAALDGRQIASAAGQRR